MASVSPCEVCQTLLQGFFRVVDFGSHNIHQASQETHDGGVDNCRQGYKV